MGIPAAPVVDPDRRGSAGARGPGRRDADQPGGRGGRHAARRRPHPSAEELARLTGRGHRSGIGLHGFRHGGFLVDGGPKGRRRRPAAARSPRLPRRMVGPRRPASGPAWPARPRRGAGVRRAPADRRAHRRNDSAASCCWESSRRSSNATWPAFGAALEELQAHVGASFAPAQGGAFSSPRAAEIVGELHQAGFVGCGQSSWGPTLYAFSDRPATRSPSWPSASAAAWRSTPAAVIVTGRVELGGCAVRSSAS